MARFPNAAAAGNSRSRCGPRKVLSPRARESVARRAPHTCLHRLTTAATLALPRDGQRNTI